MSFITKWYNSLFVNIIAKGRKKNSLGRHRLVLKSVALKFCWDNKQRLKSIYLNTTYSISRKIIFTKKENKKLSEGVLFSNNGK